MKETHPFLMPDYYPQFACKMGACRSACCVGWPISVSLDDYFRLLSLDCSPEMKARVDISLHIAEHPTPEGYAHILPRYDGQCPMRLEDGRCGLHAEMGEEVLAAVCRLYPRGVRMGEVYECSCANSCEAVVELLREHREPLRFLRMPMTIDAPAAPARKFHFETAQREEEIRLWLIGLIQKREYALPRRLILLGRGLQMMDEALKARDEAQVDALLTGKTGPSAPESAAPGREQLVSGLQTARRMMEIMDARSESIRLYGEAALAYFGSGEAAFERYQQACGHFEALLPEWEIWFEQLLANHMFFAQFPFQDRPVEMKDEFLALCVVYILLRFLCIGWTAGEKGIDAAADVCAAAFRLIDHTEFDRLAAPILRKLGPVDWDWLSGLLCL